MLLLKFILILSVSVGSFATFLYIIIKHRRRFKPAAPLSDNDRSILRQYVDFYKELDEVKQAEFERRMHRFLSTTRITGINTPVERLDELLVAASAIIPIFGFPNWEYINLNEVLLYPGPFNERFEQEGDDRITSGLVGDGPYQNLMVLSKQSLRHGFIDKTGKHNTAIHEFVHLIDKTDGAVDGIPETLLSKQYVLPWLSLVRQKIGEIMTDSSDINPYGATSNAEFFAVASEYFFERPDLLQEKHPELYDLLSQVFRQKPQKAVEESVAVGV